MPAAVDYERLAESLAALAYPLRLELLDALRFRHTLAEIRVSPHRVEPGGNPERPAAKPTVLAHLEKLADAGLVRAEEGASGREWMTNPQRMYAVVEELRQIVVQHAGHGVGEDVTTPLAPASAGRRATGPRLVLVHGVYEGRAYPLEGPGPWGVGRAREATVSLDYDPFVSVENSIVEKSGETFATRDLGSRNGTTVNWEEVGAKPRALHHGDILGVGRSRLVFVVK